MIALLEAWWAELVAAPAALAAVGLVVLASCAAGAGILRSLPGVGWRAVWAVSALGLLLATIAFVAPPPQPVSSTTPVLVTEGADGAALADVTTSIDAFVTGPAWRSPAVAQWIRERVSGAARGRTVRIASVDDVMLYGAAPGALRVLGDGLDEAAWNRARWRGRLSFTPPEIGGGFAAVDWPRRVDAGDTLPIAIAVTGATPDGATAVLRDGGGRELARGAAGTGIEGPALPTGRHVLSLALEHDGAMLEQVDVAVTVTAPVPARVLLLAAAPSFEWRALGRWLADTGARVASRVRVSASRHRQRFDGFEAMPLSPLSRELLGGFDIVIADGAAIGDLAPAEQDVLLAQQHGAGVLVLLHDRDDVERLPDALRALLEGAARDDTVYQVDASTLHLPSGLTRLGLGFSGAAGEVLLRDLSGRPVVARSRPGSPVALSLLRDSYRLVGAGAADGHAGIWSRIVRALARPAVPRRARFAPPTARAGERLRVCVPRAASIDRAVLVDGDRRTTLPLVATPWRPAERCGWAWPVNAGWLEVLADAPDRTLLGAHWVAPVDAYPTPRRLARIRATTAAATRGGSSDSPDAVPSAIPRASLLPALLGLLVSTALIERLAAARRRRRATP